MSLQLKFVDDYFDKIDIEIITDANYFSEVFLLPQTADILIISEDLYDLSIHRHNISHIFLMTEQYEENQTADLNVNRIFKYTSIKEIFNEITGNSADTLKIDKKSTHSPQIILVYSASGGTGKTTVSMGICASLTKSYKRVLYINASYMQSFQHMLENYTPIASSDVYSKLPEASNDSYNIIKHVIRKELFSYLPPFKAPLISVGLQYSVYESIARSAKKSGDYDYIVIDAESTFDEYKASLINCADKVLIITNQSLAAVSATNILASNINGIDEEKYYFVCNDFDKEVDNALILPNIRLNFTVSEYIDHFKLYSHASIDDLSGDSSIQRTAYLLM